MGGMGRMGCYAGSLMLSQKTLSQKTPSHGALSHKIRECGVVGAGGAGFPTYVKAQSQVEFMIANGAECEPLIHKDAELMRHFPAGILAGMTSMMDAVGAKSGKFGIKTKNAESLEALKHNLTTDRIE